MISGSVSAIAHGAGWPVLNIFFGEMVDGFIDYDTVLPPEGEEIPPELMYNYSKFAEDFNDMSKEYSIIFAYVGTAIFALSYVQVQYRNLEYCKNLL